MKKKSHSCDTCELKGYNPDFCKWHRKKLSKVDVKTCRPQEFYKKVGKTAVLGAGVGVVVATAGLAVVPAIGLKAVIGHALVAKVTAGGGAAGAGINVARHPGEDQPASKRDKKKSVLMPVYLGGGS